VQRTAQGVSTPREWCAKGLWVPSLLPWFGWSWLGGSGGVDTESGDAKRDVHAMYLSAGFGGCEMMGVRKVSN
jgi:hypothetical protein